MKQDYNKNHKLESFLKILEKEIYDNDFKNKLEKVQSIDLNHYTKKVSIEELQAYIDEYKNEKNIKNNNINKVLFLLSGNPEIVFKLCIEAIKNNIDIIISIEDFCLAQNTLIVELVNKVIENNDLKTKILLKNLLKDNEIIVESKNVDKTICIGNSNTYNRLSEKIDNIELNSYGIFEIFSDSDKFSELEEIIYNYLVQNEFEVELYDDVEFEDAINLINKNGYKFCSILFSNDIEKQKVFKEKISSEYVMINKNPFKEIKFNLEII